MSSARHLGPVSLVLAVSGFSLMELALSQGWVRGPAWNVLTAAFEAGTIGGMADWFAVKALFREVPLPLVRRHTNIIVKNRARIIEGISDMVQNRWLSPEVIREHLEKFSASQYLLDYLHDRRRQEKAIGVLRDLLGGMAGSLDSPEFTAFLSRVLKDQVRGINLATPLGRWMEQAIARGDHHALWELLLGSLERSLGGRDIEDLFLKIFRQAVDAYKETGWHRKLLINVAEALNSLNDEAVVRAILANLTAVVREARGNPDHPVREKLDGMLLGFAHGLATGDRESAAVVETLQRRLVENAEAGEILRKALGRFRQTVEEQLDRPDSDLSRLLRKFLDERMNEFRNDPSVREKVDAWVRGTALELVKKRHAYVGEMVRGSLQRLPDLELVAQIEAKVGEDLQYIRLNGAVVGGLVGAFLSVVRMFLFR